MSADEELRKIIRNQEGRKAFELLRRGMVEDGLRLMILIDPEEALIRARECVSILKGRGDIIRAEVFQRIVNEAQEAFNQRLKESA